MQINTVQVHLLLLPPQITSLRLYCKTHIKIHAQHSQTNFIIHPHTINYLHSAYWLNLQLAPLSS